MPDADAARGVKERYGQVGTRVLQQEYGLTAEHILEAAGQLLAR
ncbi:transketolase [Serratia marcescens]|nr:transketolase [Serratia marcescens]